MGTSINITTPVGRLVKGSLYKANTTDSNNQPLVIKHGPNAGQPRTQYFFVLAIPKGPEQHWNQTEWGKQLWALGHQVFPNVAGHRTFAWKIENGDDTTPNMNNRRPCDNEGYPGHWILRFSNGFAPRVFRSEANGWVQETQVDYVKPGYYVQVAFMADGNGSTQSPGIYLNPTMVAFRAYGPEISFGPDVNEAGFGQAPLPMGASQTPVATTAPMPAAPATTPPPPPPVVPDPAFLNPQGPKMTPKAGGIPYQDYIAKGWTDALLIQNGFMEG